LDNISIEGATGILYNITAASNLSLKEIGVMRAEVGAVSRHDLIETETIKNPYYRALLCFNTPVLPDAAEMIKNPLYTQVKVFEGKVIYQVQVHLVATADNGTEFQSPDIPFHKK
jgi:translation initiation factor IF-2